MRKTFIAAICHVCVSGLAVAQPQTQATPVSTVVTRLVSFSGLVKETNGKPLSGQVAITFSFYSEQQGGSPLWSEFQTV